MIPEYLVIDIENNSKEETRYGRKAGNFLFDKIVVIGLKYGQDNFPQYTKKAPYAFSVEAELDFNKSLVSWLQGIKIIIGHHITHDLLFLWKYEALQEWFKQGGRVWDTQVVHYILSGQQWKYPALRQIATIEYSCPVRDKGCETYWDQGVNTSDIPREIVMKDCKNDCIDTESIFLQQYKQCEEQGLLPLIESEMDFLLACCEIEFNGMKIDKQKFDENKLKLQIELHEKEMAFHNLIEQYKG